MLHAGRELASPQGRFVDGFADDGILVAFGLRVYLHGSPSRLGHRISTLVVTFQVSTHHIEIKMLVVLQVQLIIDIERRDVCFRLLTILHLVFLILLMKDGISIREAVWNVLCIVAESDVQHALFAIGVIVVERSRDVIVFDSIGSRHGLAVGNDLIWIIKHFFILAIPFQVPSAPLRQCRKGRLALVILS